MMVTKAGSWRLLFFGPLAARFIGLGVAFGLPANYHAEANPLLSDRCAMKTLLRAFNQAGPCLLILLDGRPDSTQRQLSKDPGTGNGSITLPQRTG